MTAEQQDEPRPTDDAAALRPGTVLGGKLRVERVVGRGGMGIVVEATNVQLGQKVAVKLLASGADDPRTVERFAGEARAAARLRSEHVARVYDVGKDTSYGPFIVMEMLEGRTLADVLAEVGRLPVHRALEYVIHACEGLAEAHARGIVHQDVKPGNLFLVNGSDGRPTVKVLDFGIATVRSKEREADAKSSHPKTGTPAYLAPEQLMGANVDHRADVWSLGCVLYELLTGERAFQATRFTELVTRILEAPAPAPPEELHVPPSVSAALARCLQKDPDERFATTAELALELLPYARHRAHSIVARAVGHVKSAGLAPALEMPSTVPPPDGGGDLPSSASLRTSRVLAFSDAPVGAPARTTVNAAERPPSGRRRLVVVGGVVVLFAVVGVGWGVLGERSANDVPRTSAPSPSASSVASVASSGVVAPRAPAPLHPAPSAASSGEHALPDAIPSRRPPAAHPRTSPTAGKARGASNHDASTRSGPPGMGPGMGPGKGPGKGPPDSDIRLTR